MNSAARFNLLADAINEMLSAPIPASRKYSLGKTPRGYEWCLRLLYTYYNP